MRRCCWHRKPGANTPMALLGADVAALDALLTAQGIGAGAHRISAAQRALATSALFLATMIAGRVTVPLNLLSQAPQLAYVLAHSEVRCVFVRRAAWLRWPRPGLPCCRQLVVPRLASLVNIDVDEPLASPTATAYQRRQKARPRRAERPGAVDVHLRHHRQAERRAADARQPAARRPHGGGVASADTRRPRPCRRYRSITSTASVATLSPFVSGGSIVTPPLLGLGVVGLGRCLATDVDQRGASHHCLSAQCTAAEGDAPAPAAPSSASPVRRRPATAGPASTFEQRFGIGVIEAMGMTECASVVFCNPQDASQRKYGTPGLPCGVQARRGCRGKRRGAADNATGELQLCGDNVMAGYWNAPTRPPRR